MGQTVSRGGGHKKGQRQDANTKDLRATGSSSCIRSSHPQLHSAEMTSKYVVTPLSSEEIFESTARGRSKLPLPQELIEQIVHLLSNNRAALLACNTVNYQLSSAVKPLLFRVVSLSRHHANIMFLVTEQREDIRKYIHHITLVRYQFTTHPHLLEAFSTHFPNIVRLTLRWTSIHFLRHFPYVKRLTLSGSAEETPMELARALGSHAYIEYLDIGDTISIGYSEELSSTVSKPLRPRASPGLKGIHYNLDQSPGTLVHLFQQLRQLDTAFHLERLSLHRPLRDDWSQINNLLVGVGGGLGYLELDLFGTCSPRKIDFMFRYLSLRPLTSLHTICLVGYKTVAPTSLEDFSLGGSDSAATMLRTIPGPTLRTIIFRLYGRSKQLFEFNMEDLDSLLLLKQFCEVKKIQVLVIGVSAAESEEYSDILRMQMPIATGMGILSVSSLSY